MLVEVHGNEVGFNINACWYVLLGKTLDKLMWKLRWVKKKGGEMGD